jgi:hypothetical protein
LFARKVSQSGKRTSVCTIVHSNDRDYRKNL